MKGLSLIKNFMILKSAFGDNIAKFLTNFSPMLYFLQKPVIDLYCKLNDLFL